MTASTIDEVIEILEQIIETSKSKQCPLGYFAALYQKVTIRVKDKLNKNYFDDDKRMEKLDIRFANRYLAAYADYKNGNTITKSWEVAFTSSKNNSLIVLQHLLLGMNAHINLDLGIAAAEISTKSNIGNLQGDFNKINDILGSLVEEVQTDLSRIWPTLSFILKYIKNVDDLLVNFSMKLARNGAWKFANEMIEVKEESRDELIAKRDKGVSKVAKLITKQEFMIRIIFKLIRFGERGDVADRIEKLQKSH